MSSSLNYIRIEQAILTLTFRGFEVSFYGTFQCNYFQCKKMETKLICEKCFNKTLAIAKLQAIITDRMSVVRWLKSSPYP
jgi:hypothetical protein